MDPVQMGTGRPTNTNNGELSQAELPSTPRKSGLPAPHGVLHGRAPLDFSAAVERSFLPSFAQELASRPRIEKSLERCDPRGGSLAVFGSNGSRLLTLHLLGEERVRNQTSTELTWAHTSRRLSHTLPDETRALLDSIVRLADERDLGFFHTRFLRGSVSPVPLGRLVSGLASELVERPLTPFGIVCQESGTAIYRWYLAEEGPEQAPHLIGSETERIRFCQHVIGEGFRLGHYLLSRPLDAIVALGTRFGLVSGLSDEQTAYIATPHERDCTGERLALIVRPDSKGSWAPGLSVCWGHHDTLPRPTATLFPRER